MNISSPNNNLPAAPEGYALESVSADGEFLILDYRDGLRHVVFFLNSDGHLVLTAENEEEPDFIAKDEAQFKEERGIIGYLRSLFT